MTPWYRRRAALALVHLIESLEWAAIRLYDLARRLAPHEFAAAEHLRERLDAELDELLATPAPPVDYERRQW